jgi:cysteine synthase A
MVIKVRDEDAFKMTREVYDIEGVMAGISSGAALHGAILLAKKMEQIIGTEIARSIVVILPDTGKRYLSMGLFD